MKVLAFLMLAGGACLLLATGNFHLSFNTGSDPGPNAVAATSTQGPVVRDVLAVVDAATTADGARDTQALQGLIGRAHSAESVAAHFWSGSSLRCRVVSNEMSVAFEARSGTSTLRLAPGMSAGCAPSSCSRDSASCPAALPPRSRI